MQGYEIHERFIPNRYIHQKQLPKLFNYVCGNLNNFSPNYHYWQEQFELVKQLSIVLNWKKRNSLSIVGKIYEKVE